MFPPWFYCLLTPPKSQCCQSFPDMVWPWGVRAHGSASPSAGIWTAALVVAASQLGPMICSNRESKQISLNHRQFNLTCLISNWNREAEAVIWPSLASAGRWQPTGTPLQQDRNLPAWAHPCQRVQLICLCLIYLLEQAEGFDSRAALEQPDTLFMTISQEALR